MHEELAVNFNARHQKTANQGDYHRNKTSRDHQVAIARISRFFIANPSASPEAISVFCFQNLEISSLPIRVIRWIDGSQASPF